MVTTTTPRGHRVSICTCTRMGHHLATFTRRPGSSLYKLATKPPHVAASAQTILWHNCLGHPSLPHLRGMHSRLLVSGLPRSLPPLPPSPAPPCLPFVEGLQHAALHSSSFPPSTTPLQTLHMDVWGPTRVSGQGRERYFLLVVDDYTRYTTVFPLRSKGGVSDVLILWICTDHLQLRERFGQDLPFQRLHSDRDGEFSSDLLRDFCHREGILQSFTLLDYPQQYGIAEHRIGLVMEVTRTSMIHAAAPHFLWPFAVRYAAHQLNLWPRDSLPETSPTLHWTGKVGDALVFTTPPRAVTFDESVPFYRLFPYRSAAPPPPPLFLAPGPPPVDPLPPQGPAPSGVSQVDPLPGIAPIQVAVGSGAAPDASVWGAASGGAASGGVEPGGAGSEGPGSGGAEPGGAETEGAESRGAEPRGAALPGGPSGASPRLTSQQLREWLVQRTHRRSGAPGARGAGDTGAGGAAVTTGAGGTGGTSATAPGGARTNGAGGAGSGGVGCAGAGDPREPGSSWPWRRWSWSTWSAGDTVRPRPYFVPLLQQVFGVPSSIGLPPPNLCPPPDQSQPPLQPASPLPAPSPYTEQFGGLTEHCEPESRPILRVRTARLVPRPRPPPVPGTHTMALRPSSVPLRVPLPAPPESSPPDTACDRARAASPTVARLLATAVTDPSFESAAASALVAELLKFAAVCHLDYASALVAESEDFDCLAAAVPRFASMLLAPEGDSDAPDIPTARSYTEAITSPYSSQWQAAMDAEMASWKSTGTYVDAVPLSRANIVDGMWIFRVKRPSGFQPAFKARYVAQGFSQQQGVDYFQTFSPTPKMTTLRVLLHVAAQRCWCNPTVCIRLVVRVRACMFGKVVMHPITHWVIDSGCTSHMTPRADLLDEVKPLGKIKFVAAASGALPPVIGVGNAKVMGANGGVVGLGNVLLVEGLSANLLSVCRLQKSKANRSYLRSNHLPSNLIATFKGYNILKFERILISLAVDDYTRDTTVFPLRSKGEVSPVFIPWIRTVRLQLSERFGQDLPVLRLHSDRGGEFSSDLLRDFCHGEGITQSFTLPDSPQQNGIAERRIGLVMEVACTSMIHAAAPHFLWPFADVTFAESVPFYRLFPYSSAPPPPPPLFLPPGPPHVDPLQPQGPAPSGVSQVDPLPGPAPVQVAVDSGAAPSTASGGAASRGEELGGGGSEGAGSGGAEPKGVEPGGAELEGASFILVREPKSRPNLFVRAVCTGRRVPRQRPPPVLGTYAMALRPYFVRLRVALPPPPESSLHAVADPESDLTRAASPTDPSFESTAASALVAELVDFAAACCLDYTTALVAESESNCPPLHKEIWLRGPPGFTGSFPAGTLRSLRQPVYGLRQAPREWHDTLRTTLAALGFTPSIADPLLFLRTDTSLPPFYVLMYVDDLVFATSDTEALTLVKLELQKRLTCTDLGELCSYLGLQITRDRAPCTITLTQSHMVHQVLQRFGFQFSSPQPTPLSTCHSLLSPHSDESIELNGPYAELVGYLMYLMTCTRPDLAYPFSLLARYVAPGRHQKVHWDAAKRVLRYLCSTLGMGLVLGGQGPVVLTGHADASWVDDLATQRLSQGYTFSLGSASVSWRSTRSSSVLCSSCEAEIYTGVMAAHELRWLTYLLIDLGEPPRSPPVLYVDNKAMIALCQEHRFELLRSEILRCSRVATAWSALSSVHGH
ncbi:unnamed protein product [Closterium sp. NIES-54]